MKTCRACGKTLPIQKFDSIRKGERRGTCRACRRKRKGLIVVDDPALTPLAQAQQERAKAQERADTRTQLKAALDEADRLQRELDAVTRVQAQGPEIVVYERAIWERGDAVPVAVASDWHVEEPVIRDSVHGLNEYNLEVARSRAEHFFRNFLRLVDIVARDSKVTTILIELLGDFFSGWIHEELLANTLLAPADAAIFCRDLWISGIDFLLRESSYVIAGDMIPGNHGRMTRQMHFGNPVGTSLESVMYHAIADHYRDNPRVKLVVSKQAMIYRPVFERFKLRLIHGYETKYNGGVGGLTIPLNKAIAQWDQGVRADLTVLGHYHQFLDGGRFLVNGSMIGFNLYAQAIKASFEEPRQAFFLINARNGGTKSIVAPIWLDKAGA